MRRSIWLAVLVTALVLTIPAGLRLQVDLSPLDPVLIPWEQASTVLWAQLERAAAQAGPGREPIAWGGMALASWGALVLLFLLGARIADRRAFGMRRAAARGQSVARIARKSGLAQDAVRALLVLEGAGVRTGNRGGRIFRPA